MSVKQYQGELGSIVYNFFLFFFSLRKGLLVALLKLKEIMSKQQLEEELHKPITKNFEKPKVDSFFKDNIPFADLADMQLSRKFNKEFQFLLCAIDIFNKCAWILLLKYKKGVTITNGFQKLLAESNRMLIASAKSRNVRGASHQPVFMSSCLTISHTCFPCLPSGRVSPSVPGVT